MGIRRLLPLACAIALLAACGEPTGDDGAVDARVATVVIAPQVDTVWRGDTLRVQVTVRDSSGNMLTGRPVTWLSSDPRVASVGAAGTAPSGVGTITARGEGTARIIADVDGVRDTCGVTVRDLQYLRLWNSTPVASGQPGRPFEASVFAFHCDPVCQSWNPDVADLAVSGLPVAWSVVSGGGSVAAESTVTDAAGYATTVWTLGPQVGYQALTASVPVPAVWPLTVAVYAVADTTSQLAFNMPSLDGDHRERQHIFVLRLADRARLQLTSATGNNSWPSWAPGGDRIAFVTDRDGNRELYTMRADGSEQTRVTSTAANETAPAWSPDGRWIAVSDDSGRIRLVAPDGSRDTTLTPAGAHHYQPSWAPDGTRLAAVAWDTDSLGLWGNWRIEIIGLDGSRVPLTATTPAVTGPEAYAYLSTPAWSPDGSRLAYSQITTTSCPTCHPFPTSYQYLVRFVTPAGTMLPAQMSGFMPDWSPDGTVLAYVGPTGPQSTAIFVGPPGGEWAVNLDAGRWGNSVPRWRPRPH